MKKIEKDYTELDLFGNKPKRNVFCDDSKKWLVGKRFKIIITSLPDMEEVGLNKDGWMLWIKDIIKLLIDCIGDDGVIFFYQTDRKYNGEIIDKKSIIANEFLLNGHKNILSKIVLKRDVGKVDLFRPTYSNLFGFSKKVKSGTATPDVVFSGKMLYKNAMGFNAVELCINFLKSKKIKDVVVDPFCGMGSVLKIANTLGYDSLGVDILEKQVTEAKK